MARLAGAVSIVTTDGPAGRRGVTVSAATSVSDTPPTLLFCLNRNREENRWFGENGCFSFNTLAYEHIDLARAFAGVGHLDMEQRFALGEWQQLATGAPVLRGARMSLDCKVTDVQPVATHYVIFGEVLSGTVWSEDGDEASDALVYLDRHYREL
ncbi:MAG: flavin reductase [Nitratireductor sp.]|nr:flavin reductase [Nitratireductor sp.]MCC0019728.1 flavin reductase [Nitratireductor sp.]